MQNSIGFGDGDWNRIEETSQAWWDGTLDRPLFNISLGGRDPGRPEPSLPSQHFTSFYSLDTPADMIADRWHYNLSCQHYPGDAFPAVWPNFGPGVIAAYLGLKLENGQDTVWFHPDHSLSLEEVDLTFREETVWYRRLKELYRTGLERFQGEAVLGMTDLGGNLDILSSFRPGEQLLLDLYDEPERVKKLAWDAHHAWHHYFSELHGLLRSGEAGGNPGYSAWTPVFSKQSYYVLQCDFCYMIGPEMFDEFVRPELVASCKRLAHTIYHLDGAGQLAHLDSLLKIEELDAIQWIPGAGAKPISQWPEVYRKVLDAGKKIQIFIGQDPSGLAVVDTLVNQLGTGKGLAVVGHVDQKKKDDLMAMLKRYKAL